VRFRDFIAAHPPLRNPDMRPWPRRTAPTSAASRWRRSSIPRPSSASR
jgi:hypothetical protein